MVDFLSLAVLLRTASLPCVFEAERPGCRFSAKHRMASYLYTETPSSNISS
ncbi:hypothetical protein SOVF_066030 [Spinacia oleracea]|nr:hypothetical protein SOVF_066030 [Spinacia oleracea]